jgi:APA family basic amino acid/polyamine antiporter
LIKDVRRAQAEGDLGVYGLSMVAIGYLIGPVFLSLLRRRLPVVAAVDSPAGLGLSTRSPGAEFFELGGKFLGRGQYAYLKEGYGELPAFLYAWVTFVVINGSAIAALSLTFAKYFAFILPLGDKGTLAVAVLAILGMAAVNVLRTAYSDLSAKIFTALKLAGLASIIGVGIGLGSVKRSGFSLTLASQSSVDPGLSLISAFGLAFVGVYFASGGWQHASYLAGEARDPRRTVPRAMIIGAVVVGTVYWLANLAYMLLLPVEKIAASSCPAADAVQAVLPFGGIFISVMIAPRAGHGRICHSVPRIFALASDGLSSVLHRDPPALPDAGQRHPLQTAWSIFRFRTGRSPTSSLSLSSRTFCLWPWWAWVSSFSEKRGPGPSV